MHQTKKLVYLSLFMSALLCLKAQTNKEIFEEAQEQAVTYLRACAQGPQDPRSEIYITYYMDAPLAQGALNNAADDLEAANYQELIEQTEETSLLERVLHAQETDATRPIVWFALLRALDQENQFQHEMHLARSLRGAMIPNHQPLPPPEDLNPAYINDLAVNDHIHFTLPRNLRDLMASVLVRSM